MIVAMTKIQESWQVHRTQPPTPHSLHRKAIAFARFAGRVTIGA